MIPVVEAIAQRFEVWISVDTSKAEVIRQSARAGAHIINDIRSLTEPGALQAAAETGLPVCLMHMQGQPKPCRRRRSMRTSSPMLSVFNEHIVRCEQAGIAKKNCCSTRDSVSVKSLPQLPTVGGLGEFHHFGLPLLVGMSRKSMVGQLLNVGPSERLNGNWRVPSLQQCRARRLSASMMSKKR